MMDQLQGLHCFPVNKSAGYLTFSLLRI